MVTEISSYSPLKAVIQADVRIEMQKILTEVIDPWIFFNSHGVDIPKANGKRISIKSVEFSGSPCDVFWGGFADEWIQKIGRELIESTRQKTLERRLSVAPELTDCLNEIRLTEFPSVIDSTCTACFNRDQTH